MNKQDVQNRLNEIDNLASQLADELEEQLNESEQADSPDKKFWEFASEYVRCFADDCADAANFKEFEEEDEP